MRSLYSLLMVLLSPYLLFRLWWKGRKLPDYRERIGERFSWTPRHYGPIDCWVHAVSLGEVIAASPLIEKMLESGYRVLVTTMTPTGARQVKNRFKDQVIHTYIPYDIPWALQRFYRQVRPKVGVIMETELWPNLVNQAYRAGIPLYLVNARLSQRSYKNYVKLKFFFKPLLRQFTAILAQSKPDAERFIALGADDNQVQVLGNIKFDLPLTLEDHRFDHFKQQWGEERLVIIAASTHAPEEARILEAFHVFQSEFPKALLILVPRHPERFKEVYELAQTLGFKTGLRSQEASMTPDKQVLIVDAMGELLGWYAVADFAFVGGSFAPVGGHNVLEPIAMKVPVLTGPYVFNFLTICKDLLASNAMIQVDDAPMLMQKISELVRDEQKKTQLVDNASELLIANRGVVQRYFEVIRPE